jgi:subtilisin-like proprotein convertase family protein
LNVQVSITHTHTSYLDAYLTGPDGQRVELFAEVGGHDDNFDETVFDDQARETITRARPPFKGTFTPSALSKRQPGLASFNGKNVRGVWQLIVRGTRSERFGMLHSWGLIIKPQEEILPGSTAELLSAIGESATDESVNGEPSPEGSDGVAEPATETSSATDPDAASQLQAVGFRLVKSADKNGDGVLTIDEYPEKDRQHFATIDSNGDGKVDTAEVVAALSRLKGG